MAELTSSTQGISHPRTSKTDYIIKLWTHLQSRISNIMKEETTFEQLTTFMGDRKNIKLTSSFYTMLSSFCNKEPINKESLNTNNSQSTNIKKARLILSALMISKFPLDVLDVADIKDLDPSSEACYQSAHKMIKCITNTDINGNGLGKLKCDDLLKCINQFINNFDLWKNKDLEKVLDSVVNYYEQWMRSYKILSKSSMNEAQKKTILNTLVSNMNKTQTRIAKLVGGDKAKTICQAIKDKVNAEPDPEPEPEHQPNSDQKEDDEESKENEEPETLEQKLAKKGIPINIRSGNARNLVQEIPKTKNDSQDKQNENRNEKYTKMVDGKKMLDLDMIIMEEASKRYWNEFEKQIGNGDYSRLFELLSELLERLKKLSPEKEHKHLDDLMDVSFIQQTLENGMIDAKGFYAIFYGIWSQIKTLHAPNEDKEWSAWHDYILGQFGSESATWGTLLAQVFNVFLRKMDKIEDQIKVIQHVKAQKNKN